MGALPDWLLPLPDAEEMRSIDRWAIEQRGVPSLDLMERAGTGVARAVERDETAGLMKLHRGRWDFTEKGERAARELGKGDRA